MRSLDYRKLLFGDFSEIHAQLSEGFDGLLEFQRRVGQVDWVRPLTQICSIWGGNVLAWAFMIFTVLKWPIWIKGFQSWLRRPVSIGAFQGLAFNFDAKIQSTVPLVGAALLVVSEAWLAACVARIASDHGYMFILGIHDSINELLILIDIIYYSLWNLSLCFTEFLRVVYLLDASILLPSQWRASSISDLLFISLPFQLLFVGFTCLIWVGVHNFCKISIFLKAALSKDCCLLLWASSCSNPNFLLLMPISISGWIAAR